MTTKRVIAILTAFIALTIYSCGTANKESAHYSTQEYAMSPAMEEEFQSDDKRSPDEQSLDKVETVERKIIKQGNIKFKTADLDKTQSLITQTVQELGGYISEDNIYTYSDRFEQVLTIRVPADKFDLLLKNISESAEKLESKSIDVLDVTEEFIDIEARIKTKKELQNRYIELLKRATTINEILNIEREIGSLQTEIESAEGRMRYLKSRIAFSTLTVRYYQEIPDESSFFSQLIEGVKSGWDGFLWFVVGLSYLWVFIFIAIGIIYLFRRRRRNRRRK